MQYVLISPQIIAGISIYRCEYLRKQIIKLFFNPTKAPQRVYSLCFTRS